ncbi:MAG: hypothetical protein JWS12_810 [Candidatus Saccharibacteria bacterium]|nr:hypothetical protein [Candidatus Saccharibacteria bacterium]
MATDFADTATPSFDIAPEATLEQRIFLESLEERILEFPRIYFDALRTYVGTTNPERAKIEPRDPLRQPVRDILRFAYLDPRGQRVEALHNWDSYLYGEINAAAALYRFDPTTEAEIKSDEAIKKLVNNLRKAQNDPRADTIRLTERMRVARMNKFIGRAAALKSIQLDEAKPAA